ncbi:MAG: HEAT repeat domain-containing protein [Alphaproteobacteria bacterium]|nr:HEAT repeat domain-containing protein [Alphaproteobacteria bacterium]
MTTLLGSLWLVAASALAEEPPPQDPTEDPRDAALEAARADLDALEARVRELEGAAEQGEAATTRLAALLDAASTLLDDRNPEPDRVAAAERLGAMGEPAALPFLRGATRGREPAVQAAAVAAAGALGDTQIPDDALHDARSGMEVRREAIATLVRMQGRHAGERLWAAAGDGTLARPLRAEALAAMDEGYPALLDELGRPLVAKSDFLGLSSGITANGVAGGVLLSSIGTWGRSDEAVVIGALGGSVVGVGSGVLYARTRPVTAGQGLRYASNVAWGLGAAGLATAITSSDAFDLGEEGEQNVAALYRVVGVGTGAGLGMARLRDDIHPVDVAESDLAGVLGMGLAMSASDLAWAGTVSGIDAGACRRWSLDTPPPRVCTLRGLRQASFAGAGLAGAATGIAVHAAVRDAWDLQPEDLLFATGVGAEAAWVGGWLPFALKRDVYLSHATGAATLGFTGGLVASHFAHVPPRISAGLGWGALLGNAGGYGIAALARADEEPSIATMLGVGVVGAVAGGFTGSVLDPTPGDLVMLPVFVPLAAAEGAAVAYWLAAKGHIDDRQAVGLGLTASSAAGVGLTALATQIDPDPGDMAFLGTAAAWGVWYGTMTPLALQIPGEPEDGVLTAAITGDAFVLLGGLALLRPLDLKPGRTVVPQLMGVGGATTGALVVAMASPQAEHVAAGAVIGSTVGIGAGALIGPLTRGKRAPVGLLPRVRVPGTWGVHAMPGVPGAGEPGLYVSVDATGW